MSARTAPLHSPAELDFIGCDEATGIAVFQAGSDHDAARVNTTALDTSTGTILCDCKGAEFGRVCWHMDHVVAAWHRTPAMRAARHLSATALLHQGRKAAAMVNTYRTRCGRPLQDDVLTLVAARSEWRRRAARAAAHLPATTVEQARQIVAEQENLTQSDRAIDAGCGGLTAYYASRDLLACLPLPLSA